MNTAAIYHRPESEYAYLYTKDTLHLRLRTARADATSVECISGDPYQLESASWFKNSMPMEKYLSTDLHDYWTLELGAPFKRISYGFKVTGVDGEICFYGDQGVFPFNETTLKMANYYFRLPFFHEIDRFKAPAWAKETVWYQIFPERFANGDSENDPAGTLPWGSKAHPDRDDFFGGDLAGVLAHLDHLTELGINGIYFCPIFKAASNHKYDTIDYYEIDPAFGDKELFKKLVAACHERGIKVMLDAVFNHMGDDSPQWQDVVKNGEHSRYADWFHVNEFPVSYTPTDDFEFTQDATYDTFAFTPHMPKLNTANQEVQKYLLDIATYWIKEFNIDAWRLDVANEVDHHFWKQFYQACIAEKEDFYILGEIWHSSQRWLEGDEFHAVMNYPFTDALLAYFVKRDISLAKMISNMNSQFMLYREQTNQVMFNILDSHDTPRLLTVVAENKALAMQIYAFMYLQKGVPCLYYGDEFSMTGAMDPDCRKCMVWNEEEQDLEMFAFFKNLIAFRKKVQPLLSEGKLRWLMQDEASGLVQFAYEHGSRQVVASFNSGTEAVQLAMANEMALSSGCKKTTDKEITLAPFGFAVAVQDC